MPYRASKTQWLKNLLASGGQLQRFGRTATVLEPQVTTKEAAAAEVRRPWRFIFALSPFDEVLLITCSG
ncbi:hypothetical protein [Mycobacteroides chelonae]|uniref:hypothetical protein n=1 Tax=Mycobacteroides chelonae TaxID=1774 RepID=UPI001A7E5EE3|nr:hypothetical protein [Mycobacteroides chelonae]